MKADHMNEMIEKLYLVISKLSTQEECEEFFQDLCTNKEIEQMAQRVESAILLKQGMTYSQVIEQTNIPEANRLLPSYFNNYFYGVMDGVHQC